MSRVSSFLSVISFFIFLFYLPFPILSEDEGNDSDCYKGFDCGSILHIGYPFWTDNQPEYCVNSPFRLECKDDALMININSEKYRVIHINTDSETLIISRTDFMNNSCPRNTSLADTFFSLSPTSNQYITLYHDCLSLQPMTANKFQCEFLGTPIAGWFMTDVNNSSNSKGLKCNISVVVPVLGTALSAFNPVNSKLEEVFKEGFEVKYSKNVLLCDDCVSSGGLCDVNRASSNVTCICGGRTYELRCPTTNGSKTMRNVGIGVGAGAGVLLLACVFFLIRLRRKKHQSKSSALISRSLTPDSSIKPDLERGTSSYFQTPIFSYAELQEATDNFDSSKEIGDGGFGTVYHGTLRDGRVVAVKRLYENNYKRHDQFMNELEILSRLRHRNLVTLYGCTTRHSRELLLVYEYIPNGTVADNLHGDRASTSPLTWPVRLSVAIETADALSYLHASDIIHRDVKTTNILLDHNFHVKVADFGLSRLFPINATHVSTAPQGTPGYVDPEYYQCYQLNDKSDVYSFGVVLIELISSKPAVDIGRHRHEINLSNMAINKIHNDALHELVDPSLGFESDYSVRRMITMVAELAFRCLQQEKDMRPCMMEVLKCLKDIESAEKVEKAEEVDIPADARLLKNVPPFSPTSVTDKWVSSTTTPNTSG